MTSGDYDRAQPLMGRISQVNQLHASGHNIVIHTARGMKRFNNDSDRARAEFELLTLSQLKDWGLSYDLLILGKPAGDLYVDDKAMSDIHFFSNDLID